MRHCAVLNCTNNSDKTTSDSNRVSFHHFPKDPETRQAWIYATGRINWTPRQYSTICSNHFTEYDFTIKKGKKFLRSTTVPRFNLNEQNIRYTESQYHNETQAALEFLTGQMFPESKVPEQEKAEVVTVQIIGGKNPNVLVKKPQDKPTEKKPKYFSIVNCFKSEAQLKAEKDKIDELIRDNLDPSISKILLSLNDKPVKKKKKKNGENNSQQGTNMPRAKNGQWVKLAKKPSIQSTSSEVHYTDNLTREELIRKLNQRDQKISQQQITIRNLQKTHLRDQVQIESLRIKLKLKNETAEEQSVQPRFETTNTENHYQSNRSFSDQDQQYFDTQNRHLNIGLKKPAHQEIPQKRRRLVTKTTREHYQSNRNISDQDQPSYDTQNRHADVGFKKPARQQIVTQRKRQRLETTNTENHQSYNDFSDQYQAHFETQNRRSDVRSKVPAGKKIVIHNQEVLAKPNTENRNQSNMIFSEQDRTHFWNY